MRKVTKPSKVCIECGSTLIHEEYDNFCDHCKEKISDEQYDLQITVFWEKRDDASHYEFCCWTCVFDWLKNIPVNKKMINFITLPYLSGSKTTFTEEYNEFFKALHLSASLQSSEQEDKP